MDIWSPASQNIGECEYEEDTRVLRVSFNDGRAYEYSGVPPDVVMGFKGASSAGSYFYRWIRSRYPAVEI